MKRQQHLSPHTIRRSTSWPAGAPIVLLFAIGCQQPPAYDPMRLPDTLDKLPLVRTDQLPFDAHHVQGLIVTNRAYLISSVDTKQHRAWVFRVDRKTMRKVAEADLTNGPMYHPGGMDADGNTLWVPVAEYHRNGPSVIQQLDIRSLKLLYEFSTDDHIGAVAKHNGVLYGANWDARHIYAWTPKGQQLFKTVNRIRGRYQDLDGRGPRLLAGGILNKKGVIDWIDPKSMTLEKRITTGRTPDGALYTREGISLWRNQLYLMPEDGRSKIYVFQLPEKSTP